MKLSTHMQRQLHRLAELSEGDLHAYNDAAFARKEEWLKTGASCLRAIAKEMGWIHKVSINRAGIAVSGDVSLHAEVKDGIFLAVYMSSPGLHQRRFMYRKAQDMRDSSPRGANRWMRYDELAEDPERAVRRMLKDVGAMRPMINVSAQEWHDSGQAETWWLTQEIDQ